MPFLHLHCGVDFFQSVKEAESPHTTQDKFFCKKKKKADLCATLTICRQVHDILISFAQKTCREEKY